MLRDPLPPNLSRMLGRSVEDMVEESMITIVHPDHRDAIAERCVSW